MKARELYEARTGDKCPSNQIAYSEWLQRYHAWLEETVERLAGGGQPPAQNKQKKSWKSSNSTTDCTFNNFLTLTNLKPTQNENTNL